MNEMHYMFLSGRDSTYSRRTRAHVLRKHFWTKKQSATQVHTRRSRRLDPQSRYRCPEGSPISSECPIDMLPVVNEVNLSTVNGTPLVRSLSASRRDPFSTLARRTSLREDVLIDYFARDLIQYYGAPQAGPFQPCRDACLPTSITSEASLDAMCSFASRHLALRGCSSHAEALTYRAAAIRGINSMILKPETRYGDATIMAIIGTISFNQEIKVPDGVPMPAWEDGIQLDGLRKIVLGRGGFPAFVGNKSVSWVLHWFDLLNYGRISAGSTHLSIHAFMPPSTLSVDSSEHWSTLHRQEDRLGAEEFVGAYGNFHRAAQERRIRAHLSWSLTTDNSFSKLKSLLRRLLTDRQDSFVQDREIILLFNINLNLWKYRDSLDSMAHQLLQRLGCVADLRGDASISLNVVLWFMFTDSATGSIDDFEQIWTTARLLRVYSRLSRDLQTKLKTALLQFLADSDDHDTSKSTPMPGDMRELVMRDLRLSQGDPV